ncbi:MAG: carboxylating nicotinate-nucleotide diphosphorylase [Gemmataceae bacterium]|nr:carboxylating nicotinate-nucleotide diphosphorylase [Gemmataceae bacterium]
MKFTDDETRAAEKLVTLALDEDLGTRGDVTAQATIPADAVGAADFVARAAGVIAGLSVAGLVCRAVDPKLRFEPRVADGTAVAPRSVIAVVSGPMRSLLAAERTALNFLQRLSGVATVTRRYVEAAADRSKILDTRKTTPGYRLLEKYAVRCGGGVNHRRGLDDAILIKDNHLAALGGGPDAVAKAVTAARQHAPGLPIEVEVDSWDQFEVALSCRPEFVLLDNMTVELMAKCVARRNDVAPKTLLEASGGITLVTVPAIAATGIDRISVGALTHSAPALDIALDYSAGART